MNTPPKSGPHGTSARSVGYRHGYDGIKFSPMPASVVEYTGGYALGILEWCWVRENTIDNARAEWLLNRKLREETAIDTALRLAGVDFDWRGTHYAERAAKLKPLVEAAI